MDSVKTAEQIASSNNAFGILFVLMLIVVFYYIRQLIIDAKEERIQNREDSKQREAALKKDSEKREAALIQELGRSNSTLEKISKTQEDIHHSLTQLKENVGNLEARFDNEMSDVWKEMKNRKFQKLDLIERNECYAKDCSENHTE